MIGTAGAVAACMVAPAQAAPGDLDASFGTGGVTKTHLNNIAYGNAAALDAGDRILVAGTEETYGVAVAPVSERRPA